MTGALIAIAVVLAAELLWVVVRDIKLNRITEERAKLDWEWQQFKIEHEEAAKALAIEVQNERMEATRAWREFWLQEASQSLTKFMERNQPRKGGLDIQRLMTALNAGYETIPENDPTVEVSKQWLDQLTSAATDVVLARAES